MNVTSNPIPNKNNLKKKSMESIIPLIKQESDNNYNSDYASFHLPFDITLISIIKDKSAALKRLNPSAIFLIAIGGSSLGTQAIVQALAFDQPKERLPIYFAETVDPFTIGNLINKAQELLNEQKRILIIAVTKSGTTTETIANFEIFLQLLKKYHPQDYAHYICCITDEGSPLEILVQKERYTLLSIPKKVGGRFSVFSAVGLLPLCLLDYPIDELQAGAHDYLQQAFEDGADAMAARTALAQYASYEHNIRIHDLFFFSPVLESLGKWYRQLIAESLGKQFDLQKKEINAGILPTVSIGSTDLHSMYQLYMAGQHNFFTTFITIDYPSDTLKLPNYDQFDACVKNIQGKELSSIMNAIFQATISTYQNEKLPYTHINFELNAYQLGYFMQHAMLETVLLGNLLNINPFDQPNVELYKKFTRELLKK